MKHENLKLNYMYCTFRDGCFKGDTGCLRESYELAKTPFQ